MICSKLCVPFSQAPSCSTIDQDYDFYAIITFTEAVAGNERTDELDTGSTLGMAMRQFLAMRFHGDMKRLTSL